MTGRRLLAGKKKLSILKLSGTNPLYGSLLSITQGLGLKRKTIASNFLKNLYVDKFQLSDEMSGSFRPKIRSAIQTKGLTRKMKHKKSKKAVEKAQDSCF